MNEDKNPTCPLVKKGYPCGPIEECKHCIFGDCKTEEECNQAWKKWERYIKSL